MELWNKYHFKNNPKIVRNAIERWDNLTYIQFWLPEENEVNEGVRLNGWFANVLMDWEIHMIK